MKNLAMAVVIINGKVLIQERYRPNRGRVFEFPGGAVDAEESGQQAAIRELREETGLSGMGVLGEHRFENQFGGNIYFVVLSSNSDANPRAVDPARQQEFYWYEYSEIPREQFYDADVEFIDTFLSDYLLKTIRTNK